MEPEPQREYAPRDAERAAAARWRQVAKTPEGFATDRSRLSRWLFLSCPLDLVCRERGPWRLNMCLENVDCATSKPGFSSSP